MADSDAVLSGITRQRGVSYAALTPNIHGFRRAMAARADEIAIFVSASEGFSQKNLNCSISASLTRYSAVAAAAKVAKVRVRGYVSCVTDCPFDGPTTPQQVAKVAAALDQLGCYEISLGDTIGKGTPDSITAMLTAVTKVIPAQKLAGHFHDTGGNALANIHTSLGFGLRVFDAAIGGLGGCPYAPGAPGNVATEVLAADLKQRGFDTGLDADVLARAAEMAHNIHAG